MAKPQLNLNPGLSDPKITPRGDRVLVKVDQVQRTTPSGLHVPETTEKKGQRGTVISCGPGRRTPEGLRIPITDLRPGMRIVFSKYAGAILDNAHGVPSDYSLISEIDLIGIYR